ncbi:MAG: hypothetical protein JSV24_08950 [Bacteroidales bacterium]|nr:MAG: hypothetical protein JSV24_08950 [Bacteroidales bacterium]
MSKQERIRKKYLSHQDNGEVVDLPVNSGQEDTKRSTTQQGCRDYR